MGKSSLSKPPMVLATPFSPCRAMVLQGHGAALKYNLGGKCWIYPRKSLAKWWFSDVWSNSPILCLRSMHLYNSRYTWMILDACDNAPPVIFMIFIPWLWAGSNRHWSDGNSDCKWWFCLANEPEIRSGWWSYPSDRSEKYEFVSWDDEIPSIWKNKIYVPNHQPEIIKVSFTFSVTKCCYTKEIHAKVATASRQCRTASQFHAMIKLRSTGYVPTSATFRWCHFLGPSEHGSAQADFAQRIGRSPTLFDFCGGWVTLVCTASTLYISRDGQKLQKLSALSAIPSYAGGWGGRAQGPTKVQRVPCPRDEVVKPGLVTPLLVPKKRGPQRTLRCRA